MYNHILSIILFTPLMGAILLLFVPKENKDAIRWIANIFALAGLLVSLPLVPWFWALVKSGDPAPFKFVEGATNNWIPSIGAGYVLGIDGISFLLVMLTTLLGWVSILSSWTAIENRVRNTTSGSWCCRRVCSASSWRSISSFSSFSGRPCWCRCTC